MAERCALTPLSDVRTTTFGRVTRADAAPQHATPVGAIRTMRSAPPPTAVAA